MAFTTKILRGDFMERSVTIYHLIDLFRQRFVFILISLIFFTASIFSVVYFVIPPKYEANTQLLMTENSSNQEPYIKAQEMAANLQLIQTYNDIIKSNAILTKVIEELKLATPIDQLGDSIRIVNERNSFVVTVFVEAKDEGQALEIANTVAKVVKAEIPRIISNNNITILSEAKIQNENPPFWQEPFILLAISLLLALVISLFITFVKESLDHSIKSIEDIQQPNIQVLGVIPKLKRSRGGFSS